MILSFNTIVKKTHFNYDVWYFNKTHYKSCKIANLNIHLKIIIRKTGSVAYLELNLKAYNLEKANIKI